ncbi:MAG: 50S ribosomal protein L9 [Candidatus Zambryskibacteria bacterium RIFCSPLOWO2_02_FULL_39_26]|uniref:Large ribosomal subunit protein bL9 n=1 Tax=Candidatus Zambryskibacteria bacterium RIFCSPLOWO2_12_FULL_39_23 TaxID=1802776 RepID=A0A1G2URW7_9BACT|nr:MAG: 50S ribosomal protein L9 [Candidatus Zambryskibacteria bacterium RIFCSPLOWO2_02_FULL_39_26]OHB12100.1 MAG: 50S ribosomal protein L9 [Candidatus Zambryskibacteria bacterium RIFCSPLOWO2_12_FULL_39_23]
MKIILLKDVPKVGQRYDIKNVAEGFALNMLIPRGLAEVATPNAIKKVEEMRRNDLTQKKIEEKLLVKSLENLKNLTVTLKEKANDKGYLFAGITKEMLAGEILKISRLNINPEFIKLVKPIKEVGEHKVLVEVMGKSVEFTVKIEAE